MNDFIIHWKANPERLVIPDPIINPWEIENVEQEFSFSLTPDNILRIKGEFKDSKSVEDSIFRYFLPYATTERNIVSLTGFCKYHGFTKISDLLKEHTKY